MWPGFVSREETHLRITSWNSAAAVTLTIAGLVGGADGCARPFVYTHIPNTDRSAKSTVFILECGVLLCVEVFASAGTPIRGQTFARLELLQGREASAISLGTILQGYVTANNAQGYPGSPIESPVDGPGALRSITNAAPGAGADFTVTVPANVRWRPIALFASLVTGVAVAARAVRTVYDDGATIYAQMGSNQTQAASLTFAYTTAPSNGLGLMSATDVLIPAPDWIVAPAGHRIRSSTLLIQAADQWSAQQLLVEEWYDV
jgi:hypothetical protein